MQIDKKEFWEKKIVDWENARYLGEVKEQNFIERWVRKGGGSVWQRLQLAQDILRPYLAGKIVLDLGCGSGWLFKLLADSQARSFIGIDLAESAIRNGEALSRRFGYADRVSFLVGNAVQIAFPHFDIAVSLGLFDWLSDSEIDILLEKIRGRQFLIAVAEKSNSMAQMLHRLYVFLAYGHKTGRYVPRYFSMGEIFSRLSRHGFKNLKVVRNKKMSFGAFVHNLG